MIVTDMVATTTSKEIDDKWLEWILCSGVRDEINERGWGGVGGGDDA